MCPAGAFYAPLSSPPLCFLLPWPGWAPAPCPWLCPRVALAPAGPGAAVSPGAQGAGWRGGEVPCGLRLKISHPAKAAREAGGVTAAGVALAGARWPRCVPGSAPPAPAMLLPPRGTSPLPPCLSPTIPLRVLSKALRQPRHGGDRGTHGGTPRGTPPPAPHPQAERCPPGLLWGSGQPMGAQQPKGGPRHRNVSVPTCWGCCSQGMRKRPRSEQG